MTPESSGAPAASPPATAGDAITPTRRAMMTSHLHALHSIQDLPTLFGRVDDLLDAAEVDGHITRDPDATRAIQAAAALLVGGSR